MSRRLPDIIAAYLDYTDPTEPPLSYRLWSIISVLSATLERRCWMDWGYARIYPNQYIVLVGPSGQTRKGEALRIARDLMDKVGIVLIAQSITRESLIKRMADSMRTFSNPETGEVEMHSSVTCVSEELIVFLGQGEISFLAVLTDWYDCAKIWTYETKNKGTDVIQGICLNLLAATAQSWIPSMLPREAIGGGWTSRVIFVVEDYKGKIIADPNASRKDKSILEDLAYDLSLVRTMDGPFEFSKEAHNAYIEWYTNYEKAIKAGKPAVPDPRFAGYMARRATHIKKVCMTVSASRGDDMIITISDFNRSLKILEMTEAKAPKAFKGVGENKIGLACQLVLGMIEIKGKVKRSHILAKYYEQLDVWTLDRVVELLVGGRIIQAKVSLEEQETYYEPGSNFQFEPVGVDSEVGLPLPENGEGGSNNE